MDQLKRTQFCNKRESHACMQRELLNWVEKQQRWPMQKLKHRIATTRTVESWSTTNSQTSTHQICPRQANESKNNKITVYKTKTECFNFLFTLLNFELATQGVARLNVECNFAISAYDTNADEKFFYYNSFPMEHLMNLRRNIKNVTLRRYRHNTEMQ